MSSRGSTTKAIATTALLMGAVLAAAHVGAAQDRAGDTNVVGGVRAGQSLFQRTCGTCHAAVEQTIGGRAAPALKDLQEFPPERVYDALVQGKMQDQAAGLTDLQKRQISEWVSNRPLGSADAGDMAKMGAHCKANPRLNPVGHSWAGWGPRASNDRFQPAAAAGLKAADLASLKVKWSFGIPNGADTYSQPTVVGGRVFFGSDTGFVYAVNADTGCIYWSYRAAGGVRSAPTFGAVKSIPGVAYALYFGDGQGRAYAVDAQTGKELWKRRVDLQPRAHVTASPAVSDGRVFVPIAAGETLVGGASNYACCVTRGAVVALNGETGEVLWRTETIAEPAKPRGKNASGVQLWGPAGASVWNTPTVDRKRGLVYVGTGNAYTEPAPPTSDAILALDVRSGAIVWSHQEFSGDAFISGCQKTNAVGGNCPTALGPDWDFGGASVMMERLPGGRDVLIAAGKGGVAIALDPDARGKLIWRTVLYEGAPPSAGGLVVFGGTSDGTNLYFPLNRTGGGVTAVRIADGAKLWSTGAISKDRRGQSAAATAIPGVVFTGGWDGTLRAVSPAGKVIWEFDTLKPFATVNGVPAKGGSLGSHGPAVVDGKLFLGSGYIGTQNGTPGNVVLALAKG